MAHGYREDKNTPGLYKVLPSLDRDSKWSVELDKSTTMPFAIGVLGAAAPSESGVSSALETAITFAATALSGEKRKIGDGFSLFYTPTYVIDGVGVWLTSDQKRSTSAGSPTTFAQLLANTAKKPTRYGDPERYKWYIVGQGAKVFQKALSEYKHICKVPLSQNHEFYFVDPQIPLGLIKDDLFAQGIHFYHDRNVIEDKMTLVGQINQFFDPTETYRGFHRSAGLEKMVIESVRDANKVIKNQGSTGYVCDYAQQLCGALSRKWGA